MNRIGQFPMHFAETSNLTEHFFTCWGSLRAIGAKHDRQVAIKSCGGLGDGVHLKEQSITNNNLKK